MGRTPKPWKWAERDGYGATVRGKRYFLGTNERDAKRRLKELLESKPVESAKGTVKQLLDQFLEHIHKNKASETYKWHLKYCQAFADVHGDKRIGELQPHHIEEWINSHEGWGDGTKAGAFRSLRTGFNWGVKRRMIPMSPMLGAEKPTEPTRETVVSKEEHDSILKRTDEAFKDLLTVAWESGARPQELLRVTSSDVDSELGAWVFERTNSKGKKLRRIVFLSDEALRITRDRMKKYPLGPLFRNADGQPWTPFSVNCRFNRLKKHLGKKLCLYNWRHSFAHHGLKSGIDPVTMAALMGHTDSVMLSRVYSHLLHDPKYMRESLKKLT